MHSNTWHRLGSRWIRGGAHASSGLLDGTPGQAAVLASALGETTLAYGAETRNAQMASGATKALHNPWKPFGPRSQTSSRPIGGIPGNTCDHCLGRGGVLLSTRPFDCSTLRCASPAGPGVAFHLARNSVAMSGLRIMSAPCQRGLQHVCDRTGVDVSEGTRVVVADMIANLAASALSMPLHQVAPASPLRANTSIRTCT